MALTADQTALLQTAIENLNKSVEVNQEVLNVVKSVGNTGAVDIATHNTDPEAHQIFNKVHASSGYFIGNTNDLSSAHFYREVNTSNKFGRLFLNAYCCFGESDRETGADGFQFQSIGYLNDYSNPVTTAKSFPIISFKGKVKYNDDAEKLSNQTTHVLEFGIKEGKYQIWFGAQNTDKTNTQLYLIERTFYPVVPTDLGTSTYQWKDCYLQNSPIVSSDERLKQDIEEIPEAVFKAWARVNFKQYRFKEAVASKGDDARKHVGLIAQHILAAFEAEGLDATDYGIVCHGSWDDQYVDEQVIDVEAVYDKDGNVVTPEKSHTEKRFVKAAGDVWTVRYEEALALETAYQRWRLSKIEAALEAKGITL